MTTNLQKFIISLLCVLALALTGCDKYDDEGEYQGFDAEGYCAPSCELYGGEFLHYVERTCFCVDVYPVDGEDAGTSDLEGGVFYLDGKSIKNKRKIYLEP